MRAREAPLNLFLVGDGAVEGALRAFAERLPFFPGRPVETWSFRGFAAAWVQHEGLSYVHAREGEFALFAGRPFVWTGSDSANGRAPLDPSFWLRDQPDADGRFAAVRFDGDVGWRVASDPLGAYPLFETEVEGTRYVSNNAELLRSLRDTRELSLDSLAGLLGGGWPLDGHPMWDGVRRINTPRGGPLRAESYDPDRAAARLVAATGALADWPGRPSIVPVTGGRDSRLVLGAAVAAGIEFETRTGGVVGHPDVEVGRALAETAGVPWDFIEHDPHGSLEGDWRRATELLLMTTAGTASLSDAIGFPFGPRPGPLPLWHSGQGGEVARGYYGADPDLYAKFTGRRPGRAELLNDEGRAIVRRQIEAFVADQDAPPAEIPALFYLWRRMGTWAGPTHGAVEYVRDTTSPLWSRRIVEDMLAAPPGETFHREVLQRLAPQLLDIPFEDGRLLSADEPGLRVQARRATTLARKVGAEVRRRVLPTIADPFDATLSEIRTLVLDQADHASWRVLDQPRVEQLLTSDAGALDTMSRYYVWRLATVFSAQRD